MVRWWDRWLRGRRNGVDEAPPVTVFVRHATRPPPTWTSSPACWRDEPAWPPERARSLTLPLSGAAPRLRGRRPAGGARRRRQRGLDQLRRAPAVRAAGRPAVRRRLVAGVRLGAGRGAGGPRPSAAGGPGRVVGAGGVPVRQAVRRVPDGTSALVARGSSTWPSGGRGPTRSRCGRVVEAVELELDATSWVFPAGHRLRLSLAGTDWPNLVPPPAPVTPTVERDGSALTLPASTARARARRPRSRPTGQAAASTPDPRSMPSPRTPRPAGGSSGTCSAAGPRPRSTTAAGPSCRTGRCWSSGTRGRSARRWTRGRPGPAGRPLPHRVAGGDRRHQRPARPARRRRRLRGPARPGGPRGRRASLGPDLAPPHPPPPLPTPATRSTDGDPPRQRSGPRRLGVGRTD